MFFDTFLYYQPLATLEVAMSSILMILMILNLHLHAGYTNSNYTSANTEHFPA